MGVLDFITGKQRSPFADGGPAKEPSKGPFVDKPTGRIPSTFKDPEPSTKATRSPFADSGPFRKEGSLPQTRSPFVTTETKVTPQITERITANQYQAEVGQMYENLPQSLKEKLIPPATWEGATYQKGGDLFGNPGEMIETGALTNPRISRRISGLGADGTCLKIGLQPKSYTTEQGQIAQPGSKWLLKDPSKSGEFEVTVTLNQNTTKALGLSKDIGTLKFDVNSENVERVMGSLIETAERLERMDIRRSSSDNIVSVIDNMNFQEVKKELEASIR